MGVEVPFAVERDTTGDYIVSDDLTQAHGTGPTEQDACADYLVALGELTALLLKDGDSLQCRINMEQFDRLAAALLAARGGIRMTTTVEATGLGPVQWGCKLGECPFDQEAICCQECTRHGQCGGECVDVDRNECYWRRKVGD